MGNTSASFCALCFEGAPSKLYLGVILMLTAQQTGRPKTPTKTSAKQSLDAAPSRLLGPVPTSEAVACKLAAPGFSKHEPLACPPLRLQGEDYGYRSCHWIQHW